MSHPGTTHLVLPDGGGAGGEEGDGFGPSWNVFRSALRMYFLHYCFFGFSRRVTQMHATVWRD